LLAALRAVKESYPRCGSPFGHRTSSLSATLSERQGHTSRE
jgi:hypothetical protein